MSTAIRIPADSLYASVRARLEARGHRIDQADHERRRLVVRPPQDETKVEVRIVAMGDSATISVVPLGNPGLTAGLRAMLTVTHDATIERATSATAPESTGIPGSRWIPELIASPAGRMWIARGGLYTADSLRGRWELVLGRENDPVPADELRTGIDMAFVSEDTAFLGLPDRERQGPVLYWTSNRGKSWSPVATPGVVRVDAMGTIGRSVWILATRWEDEQRRGTFLRSSDGGATWERPEIPAALNAVTSMYRVSPSVAYASTMNSRETRGPVFWRTTDGGTSWSPLPTPHDQRVHEVPSYGVRIEEIAPVGNWLFVREYGKVFVTRGDSIAWRSREDLKNVAPDRERDQLFALTDAMQATMLDRNLAVLWRTEERIPEGKPSNVTKLLARDGVGYVSMIRGEVYEAREGRLTLVPSQRSR